MISLDNVKITTGAPAPIQRSTGEEHKMSGVLASLDLDEDNALEITSASNKEHKAAQRNINVIMKKLKKTHPEMAFVTRTVSVNEDGGMVLGVYRIK